MEYIGANKKMKIIYKKIAKLVCYRCNYDWIKRYDKMPKYCPHCKSKYWDRRRGWYKIKKKESELFVEKITKKLIPY